MASRSTGGEQSKNGGQHAMPTRNKAVIKYKKVEELILGDKVLTGIMGYKGRTLFPAGHILSVTDINFLKKQLDQKVPKLADEMYEIDALARCDIKDKSGTVIIERGKKLEEDKLQPLLDSGYRVQAIPGGKKMLTRGQEWPKDVKWYITDINPQVQVETTELVTVDDSGNEPVAAGAPKPKARRGRRGGGKHTTPKAPEGESA